MENGVQLRLDLQWKNRRVDPLKAVFKKFTSLGFMKGVGATIDSCRRFTLYA